MTQSLILTTCYQVTRNEPFDSKVGMVYIVIKPKYLIKNLINSVEVVRLLSCPKLLLRYQVVSAEIWRKIYWQFRLQAKP